MDTVDPMRFVLASILVLGLLGVFAAVLKRYAGSLPGGLAVKGEGGRLAVLEVRHLDAKRKLVLVKRDGVQHLLLLGDGHETVIESGIKENV